MERRLIINADDFGMTEGISEGIIKAHLEGVVTSTTLMANMPAAAYAIKLAQKTPDLGVGIHLNLTTGRPISTPEKVRTLVDKSGTFYPQKILISRLVKWKIDRLEILAEFTAQIEKALELGLFPTHLDSHHHIHLYPIVTWAFLKVAEKFSIYKMRTHRLQILIDRNYKNAALVKLLYWRKAILDSPKILYKTLVHQILVRKNMILPHYIIAPNLVLPASKNDNLQNNWMRALSLLPMCNSEISCHPGYVSDELKNLTVLTEHREEELELLISSGIKESIMSNQIELITYKKLV